MNKNAMIKKLVVSTIACVAMGCVFITPNATTANAAAADWVMAGAAVRYDANPTEVGDDGTGLRFGLNATTDFISSATEIGFLVIPSNQLDENEELTVYTEDAVMNPKTAEDWETDSKNSSYQIAYSYLWDVPLTASEWEVTARGYALVNNQYVYTPAITRSMRSVAVAASADSETSSTIRDGIKKYMDEGNVAYFGTQYGLDYCGYNWTSGLFNGTPDIKETVVDCNGNASQAYSATVTYGPNNGWQIIKINNPAIKDITPYKYLSVWTYIGGSEDATFALKFNGVEVAFPKKEWKQMIFTNDGTGKFMTENGQDIFSNTIKANNIDGFTITLSTKTATNQATTRLYLADMRVSNTLPMLDVKLANNVDMGASISVTDMYEAKDANNARVETFVSVDGNESAQLTNNTYNFAQKGVYTFTFKMYADELLAPIVKTLAVTVGPKQTKVVDFTATDASTKYGLTPAWNSTVSHATNVMYPVTGEYSTTKVKGGNDYAYVKATTPEISDVTAYSYAYIDIYVEKDMSMRINSAETYDKGNVWISLTGGKWNRVIFEVNSKGHLAINGESIVYWYASKFGTLYIQCKDRTSGATNHVYYLGGMYACNELPTLPTDMVVASTWTKA